jgi:L-ascorbate metabolism protein UlaG (beta-lactamase superfamily)
MGRLFLCVLLVLAPGLAEACGAIASRGAPLRRVSTAEAGVQVTFLGHASFLIRSPAGVTAVTDYNGMYVPENPPTIATMNHAHSMHYTDHPDPRIRHVLRGWATDGKPAHIDLLEGDMRVRNLPTNIRDGNGGTEYYGNSIFVFETAGLCIAHLSHLHHLLNADDLAELGQIDVVMAPIDGMFTLSHEDLAQVLDSLHPRLVLPMHSFGAYNMQRFLELMRDRYAEVTSSTMTVTLSREALPQAPEILVLPGRFD